MSDLTYTYKSLMNIVNSLNGSIKKTNKLINNLNRYKTSDIIRLDNFAFDSELSIEQAKTVLNTLCNMNIMKTQEVCRCPKCSIWLGTPESWKHTTTITCFNCNKVYSDIKECDKELLYSICANPELRLFTVEWLDKFEKDSNGNPLPRKVEVIGYTKADAESLIHEYYHYIARSIKVYGGLKIENKMLLKEYN